MAGIDRELHVEGLGASREHAWAGVPGVMIFTAFGLHLVRSCAIGPCAGRPRVGNCERNMWWIFCLRFSMLQAQLASVGMSVETLRMVTSALWALMPHVGPREWAGRLRKELKVERCSE